MRLFYRHYDAGGPIILGFSGPQLRSKTLCRLGPFRGILRGTRKHSGASLGGRGAHVTFGGPRGTRATVGLPGTGLSYTEVSKPHPIAGPLPAQIPAASPAIKPRHAWLALLLALAVLLLGAWRAGLL